MRTLLTAEDYSRPLQQRRGRPRSPMVLCFDRGLCSDAVDAERTNFTLIDVGHTLYNLAARYGGVVQFGQR